VNIRATEQSVQLVGIPFRVPGLEFSDDGVAKKFHAAFDQIVVAGGRFIWVGSNAGTPVASIDKLLLGGGNVPYIIPTGEPHGYDTDSLLQPSDKNPLP